MSHLAGPLLGGRAAVSWQEWPHSQHCPHEHRGRRGQPAAPVCGPANRTAAPAGASGHARCFVPACLLQLRVSGSASTAVRAACSWLACVQLDSACNVAAHPLIVILQLVQGPLLKLAAHDRRRHGWTGGGRHRSRVRESRDQSQPADSLSQPPTELWQRQQLDLPLRVVCEAARVCQPCA